MDLRNSIHANIQLLLIEMDKLKQAPDNEIENTCNRLLQVIITECIEHNNLDNVSEEHKAAVTKLYNDMVAIFPQE